MSKRSQNKFPGLAIVGQSDKKPQQRVAGARWWGPPRTRTVLSNPPSLGLHTPSQAIRMAVMPTLSRNVWLTVLARIWDFIRDYFVSDPAQQRGAVVLSFRRHAAQGRGLRGAVTDDAFMGKKSSGSVLWNGDERVAPQEGGTR